MIRYALPVIAFLALFAFPYPVSGFLVLLSALVFPFSGIALGTVADILYFSQGAALMPWGIVFGALATGLSLLVRRFVKTRIMDA